jgi:hypothetical protein
MAFWGWTILLARIHYSAKYRRVPIDMKLPELSQEVEGAMQEKASELSPLALP